MEKQAHPIPDFTIDRLGPPSFDSPLVKHYNSDQEVGFVEEDRKIVIDPSINSVRKFLAEGIDPPSMEVAGPRKKLFFNPDTFRAAIVTCGGVCPGLNNVIRSIFMELYHRYHVKTVLGIKYGFSGLVPRIGRPPVVITPSMVENIHRLGGTLLGSSRGPQNITEMVDFLQRERINCLFTIGGDGTQRGALELAGEIDRRNLKISVIGIPKTIDNDISYVERSFGFQTAVSVANEVLKSGHEEARGAYHGVCVVKLMGRHSGFIAAHAAVTNGDANIVLIPEVPFEMEGNRGFLAVLAKRLEERGHALVVVAEGAGQDILEKENLPKTYDASGNLRLADIGIYMRDRITHHFSSGWNAATVRYIDPSYIIRSSPATSDDAIFCNLLGHHAVHAALSGRTKIIISLWLNTFTHVPMSAVISQKKRLDPSGSEWFAVLETTGQPSVLRNE